MIIESLPALLIRFSLVFILAALAYAGPQKLFDLLHVGRWLPGVLATILFGLTLAWYIVDWTNDYLVLTSQRVVHVERYGLVREVRAEIPISEVQNVLLSTTGVVQAVLKLANVTVSTIGGKLVFKHTLDAEHLQARILDQRTRVQQESRHEERQAMRQELLRILVPASAAQPVAPVASVPAAPSAAVSSVPKAAPKPSWRERLRPKMRVEKPGEIIWRKHWLVLVWRLILPVLLLLVGPMLSIALWLTPWAGQPRLTLWVILLPLVLVLPALFWVWWRYALWRGDEYIVTMDRIIDIERHPLGLKESRREGPLQRIQDIEVDITGIPSTLFNIGNVFIKTGAAGSDFTFKSVPDPRGVQRDVWRRLADYRRREQEQQRRHISEEVTRWLSVYNEVTTQL